MEFVYEKNIISHNTLIEAVSSKNVNLVKKLISKAISVNAIYSRSTSLLNATYNEDIEIIKILIGADVNVSTVGGYTSLISAASSRIVEIVRMLLDSGVDVHAMNLFNNTALYYSKKDSIFL